MAPMLTTTTLVLHSNSELVCEVHGTKSRKEAVQQVDDINITC